MENKPSTHDEYVKTLKSTFINLGKKAAVAKITKAIPFLALGPMSALTSMAVEAILTIVVNETETGLFFIYTDMRVNSQGRDFSKAALHNFKMQQSGTKEQKDEAEKALITAFNKLVKFSM